MLRHEGRGSFSGDVVTALVWGAGAIVEPLGPGLVRDRGGQRRLGLIGEGWPGRHSAIGLGPGWKVCVSSFGRWLLASQACLPSRPASLLGPGYPPRLQAASSSPRPLPPSLFPEPV